MEIGSEKYKRTAMQRADRPADRTMQIRRKRLGEEGSLERYSATYLDRAVESPAVVTAKQIVETGKIS